MCPPLKPKSFPSTLSTLIHLLFILLHTRLTQRFSSPTLSQSWVPTHAGTAQLPSVDLEHGHTTPPPPSLTGCNLGGWLVLEPWMSRRSQATNEAPADCCGEFCISQYWARNLTTPPGTCTPSTPLPPVDYDSIDYTTHPITQHRKAFITSEHLDTLQQKGIKFLRLNLGHWATQHEPVYPYVPGTLKYVDWLMSQARQRRMSVMLTMHAAVGGQNPWEHSSPEKPDHGGFCGNDTAVKITVSRVQEWALRYRWNPALWGIGLLNEPACSTADLTAYYDSAYKAIRSVNLWAYVVASPLVYGQGGDAGGDQSNWQNADMMYWAKWVQAHRRAALDLHHYHTDWALGERYPSMTLADHMVVLQEARQRFANFLAVKGTAVVIGEWSTTGPPFTGDDWRLQYEEFTRQQVAAYTQPGILANTVWSARVDYNDMWGLIS